jgi:hypothetical protein
MGDADEDLGTQNIEASMPLVRVRSHDPAGAIGNERPIEITYEKWYSKELQLVVMSKHNDPRFGDRRIVYKHRPQRARSVVVLAARTVTG